MIYAMLEHIMKRIGLLILFFFFLAVRFVPIAHDRFPFAYDNAKDSLSMMNMWETKKPTFLGPVTSLEGLYQGPLWYYIALPLNILLSFHPFASVLTILVIASTSFFLLYTYMGFWEAFLFATGTGFITTTQTAWAPYIIIFPVLFLMSWIWKQKKILSTGDTVLIACALGSLFHFEIAFGIVFLPLFFLSVWRTRITIRRKQLVIGLLVFLLFFVPHGLFEIKHQFLQTRGVIHFITHFKEQQAVVTNNLRFPQRVGNLTSSLLGTLPQAVVPVSHTLATPILVIAVFFYSVRIYKRSQPDKKRIQTIVLPILIGIFLLYLILPFKPFYLVSLLPMWILLIGSYLRRLPKSLQTVLVVSIVILSLSQMRQSAFSYERLEQTDFFLLSSREKAVETAYSLVDGRPFASYQYVPEVYDFTYQEIFLSSAKTAHRTLPTEFGYLPGQTAYNPWNLRAEHTSQLQTLIVEKDERPQFFPAWWDTMTKGREIISTVNVNDVITVYLTQPKLK